MEKQSPLLRTRKSAAADLLLLKSRLGREGLLHRMELGNYLLEIHLDLLKEGPGFEALPFADKIMPDGVGFHDHNLPYRDR